MDIGKYNPRDIESKIYKLWQDNNLFSAKIDTEKKSYTIVIPPPNVTGILHMGHGLNNTIQDILIRWKRMQGFEVLWLPGTDHAGIATQNVVEKELLKSEKKTRDDIGRERFLELIWKWKEENGNFIIEQLKRLGASCDWNRLRFTMDEGLTRAVQEVFIRLYKKDLIYRGNYIINWCPRCRTALSDEEVEHREHNGKLYYIKYPFKNKKGHIVVATTRPETMLGDTAVAVNPGDKRFKKQIGLELVLPVVNRIIPLIEDEFVDIEFGTGCVKVTPAHDPNDYEIAKRHDLEKVVVIDEAGKMTDKVPEKYRGLDRFECRKILVKDLEGLDLIEKVEDYIHSVGHCYRCDVVVEPYLSKQWFVRMKPLAKRAIEVVENGKVKFLPERWKKVYMNWMLNIRDWCISRQIWWGHRLPVWYCRKMQNARCKKQNGIIVSIKNPGSCPYCKSEELVQENDVLDTWFSSWLWPFSTLGWPEDGADLKYFYPTDTLVTDPGIIFFWVARMIMAGLEFTGKIPFKDVYLHGTVMDAQGRKMSKSLGNGIDPIEVIEKFGADSLRYTIVSLTPTGQNTLLSMDKFYAGRYFANKIWNAARYILMNLNRDWVLSDFSGLAPEIADRWVLHNVNVLVEEVTNSLENYRFNEALLNIHSFFWHKFCDWYLEISKLGIKSSNEEARKVVTTILIYVLKISLKLLHPFMPFLTERIWLDLQDGSFLMTGNWPEPRSEFVFEKENEDFNFIREVIIAIRNIRSSLNIKPEESIETVLQSRVKNRLNLLDKNLDIMKFLTKSSGIEIAEDYVKGKGMVSAVCGEVNIYVPIEDIIDVKREKTRLEKQLSDLKVDFERVEKKINNDKFLGNAPAEVVEKEKEKYVQLKETIRKVELVVSGLG